jgi:hypothetical protein
MQRIIRRKAAALAAVAGLAGAAVAVIGTQSPSGAAAAFGSPVVVTQQNVSEPGVDVASDGTIYINGPSGLLSNLPGSPSPVFRSTDGGATFVQTPASLRANLPGGGDSDISIDPATGALYMTDLWLGSSTVSSSTDKGQSWIANPVQGTVVQDRQWIATTGNQVVYHATHQIPSGLIVSKSIDGGLTFPIQVLAATPLDQTGCVCPPGNLIAEPASGLLGTADKVGLVYATSTGGVGFARSSNGGLTYTNTAVSPASSADTGQAFPVVADAGNGKLSAVWLEVIGNTSRIQYNSSNDFGATWGTPRTLVSGGASVYPWVDARGGKVAVSLYHTSTSGTPSGVPASTQWFESYVESTDGGATFSSLITADPTVAKTGIICTGGINCSSDRELGDFQQVTIDPQGRANLTYDRSLDSSTGDTITLFLREL